MKIKLLLILTALVLSDANFADDNNSVATVNAQDQNSNLLTVPQQALPNPTQVQKQPVPQATIPDNSQTKPNSKEINPDLSQPQSNTNTPGLEQPTPNAEKTNIDDKIISIPPKNLSCNYKFDADKEVGSEVVIRWSEKAAEQTFNYNYDNIKDKLNDLKNCFTDKGWKSYTSALDKSGNVESITSQKITVSSQVDGASKISKIENKKWQLKVPLQVIYQSEKEKLTQLLFVDMLIARKASGELGIMQIIAAPRDKMIEKKINS